MKGQANQANDKSSKDKSSKDKSSKDKSSGNEQPVAVRLHSDVARAIRQHGRSSMSAEICGVLVGTLNDGTATIHSCIAGANAAQGGTHVTFTQDTWEHIYAVKDRDYPADRILGWYHSHPGFGVFLSEHDTFIHRNFFSAGHQVAWVFDPHSDEEGCFGWNGDAIERLRNLAVVDVRGGEIAGERSEGQAVAGQADEARGDSKPITAGSTESDSLERLALRLLALLLAAAFGFAVAWFVFPRIEVVPVPVDPRTGLPLREFMQPAAPSPAGLDQKDHSDKGGTRNGAQ